MTTDNAPSFATPANEAELLACLKDPRWRIASGYLYKIKNKEKQIVPFVPNEAQMQLLNEIWYRNVIPKARQRGFSTVIQLLGLDTALFLPGTDAGVIAQDLVTAQDIFSSKLKLAYDHLPALVRSMVGIKSDTTTSMTFTNGSQVRVGTSMRGGTPNFVHVSEFGKIAAQYPKKAREVLTGVLPAVPADGMVFIESTSEGKGGAFYEMVEEARKVAESGRKRSNLQFKLHFASWWDAAEYCIDPSLAVVTAEDHDYFDKIETQIGRKLSPGQRAWYVTTRQSLFAGDEQMMFQEYPSTLAEAFSVSTKGKYYTKQFTEARKAGRIRRLPKIDGVPAYTFWDIGSTDGTAIWVMQFVQSEWRCIKFIEGWGESYSHFTQELQKLGLMWGEMFLPHDADHVRQGQTTNKSPKQMLEELMPGVRFTVVPVISDVNWGIQQTRKVFPMLHFDEVECAAGISHLEMYGKRWNPTQAIWSDTPDKSGGHSEAGDALRQFAQAYEGGLINVNRGATQPKRRQSSWRTA